MHSNPNPEPNPTPTPKPKPKPNPNPTPNPNQVSTSKLKRLSTHEHVSAESPVWAAHLDGWTRYSAVPDLVDATADETLPQAAQREG